MLEAIEIDSAHHPAQVSIICLHGLGTSGHDLVSLAEELKLPAHLAVRFIFPHAPRRPVSLSSGLSMPAWYDIHGLQLQSIEDEVGIRGAATQIGELIEREQTRGIDSKHIFLAGFSQGGALSLFTGLRYPKPLGGIIALSCYLPLANKLNEEVNPVNQLIPIFLAHGVADPVVPIIWAQYSRRILAEIDNEVSWHEYPMMHQLCDTEIRDVSHWITKRLLP
jgi:phospholipase/carboxylesterase